jgi:hypothetical protein
MMRQPLPAMASMGESRAPPWVSRTLSARARQSACALALAAVHWAAIRLAAIRFKAGCRDPAAWWERRPCGRGSRLWNFSWAPLHQDAPPGNHRLAAREAFWSIKDEPDYKRRAHQEREQRPAVHASTSLERPVPSSAENNYALPSTERKGQPSRAGRRIRGRDAIFDLNIRSEHSHAPAAAPGCRVMSRVPRPAAFHTSGVLFGRSPLPADPFPRGPRRAWLPHPLPGPGKNPSRFLQPVSAGGATGGASPSRNPMRIVRETAPKTPSGGHPSGLSRGQARRPGGVPRGDRPMRGRGQRGFAAGEDDG